MKQSRGGVEIGLAIAAALIVVDRVTKHFVSQMVIGKTVLGLSFLKVVNPVGVFGFAVTNIWLEAFGIAVCVFLAGLLIWRARQPWTRLGLWLLLGGAFSNLIDRFQHGGVVDIVAIGGSSRFNVADAMIMLGAVALVRSLWWEKRSQ